MSLINWTTYIYKLKKKHEIYHEQPNMTRLKDVEKEENMQKGMIKFIYITTVYNSDRDTLFSSPILFSYFDNHQWK